MGPRAGLADGKSRPQRDSIPHRPARSSVCRFIKFILGTKRTALIIFSRGAAAPSGSRPPYYEDFTITLRRKTLVKTPLDD